MSILFNRLKALKKKKTPGPPGRISRESHIYTLRRFVFSPAGALLILFVVVVFGVFSYYSLVFLKSYIDRNKTASFARVTPTAARTTQPEKVTQSSREKTATPGDTLDPADPLLNPPQMPKSRVTQKATPGKLFIPRPQSPSNTEPYQKPAPEEERPPADKAVSAKTRHTSMPPQVLPVPETRERTRETKPDVATLSRSSSQSRVAATPEEIETQKKRALKQTRMKHTASIIEMTREIETAIRNNELQRADELIDTLAKLKNPKSHYFLKLRAFMDIKAQNYESATRLLERVLDMAPEDLEANLNMAIIEIKLSHTDRAKKRLYRLRESHPVCPRVDELIRRL